MVYRLRPLKDDRVLCLGPLAVRLVIGVGMTVALTCAGLMASSAVEQYEEEKKIKELAQRLSEPSTCKVVGYSSHIEERERKEDAGGVDPKGCEGELCRDEFRSWVTVQYRAKGQLIESRAWSHLDETWESEEAVVQEFLDKFAHIGSRYSCWFDPAEIMSVRLWDKHASRFCSECPSFWVPVGLLSVWVLCGCVFLHNRVENVPAASNTTDYSNFEYERKEPKSPKIVAVKNPLQQVDEKQVVKKKPPRPTQPPPSSGAPSSKTCLEELALPLVSPEERSTVSPTNDPSQPPPLEIGNLEFEV
eukprot:TRINITY_DN4969_c0_g1_i1.p1 TRINITY_DN4969_c0_g1~~TRINITY_DN4969_c0_g1_i1.p1  ORF type:complete len:304 (+),score=42.57 TRINITY_DN4969_c0_g1_i1:34-945(+)